MITLKVNAYFMYGPIRQYSRENYIYTPRKMPLLLMEMLATWETFILSSIFTGGPCYMFECSKKTQYTITYVPVSYTHLDVYKRQLQSPSYS